ncbi:MAG TPA: hypothetical protein PKN29_13100 [Candidatus Ozemobacteraceae bacterium]|nr:hypothetical protein [Candidatus Ozemobacteraceae bacterium]HNW11269.1 hypothetical protein [Candidatus Rifleibacterium sp.]
MNDKEIQSGEEPEKPTQIKLEIQTPLEKLFFWLLVGAGFVLFNGIIAMIQDGRTGFSVSMFSIGIIFTLLFWSLKKHTDNFYILDLPTRRLFYHFKFFFIKRVSLFRSFSELAAITVSGQQNRNKSHVWWTYRILALDKQGRVFALSDDEKSEDRCKMLASAAKIADITGASFFEIPAEKIARARNTYENFEFYAVEHRGIDSFIDFLKTFAGVMAFLVATIAMVMVFQAAVKWLGL